MDNKQGERRLCAIILLCTSLVTMMFGQSSSEKSKSGYLVETSGFVDLGLPSGTLWAACNIGASSPEEFGGYYAWGEIVAKSEYYWDNYFDTKNYDSQDRNKYFSEGENGEDDFNFYYPEGGRISIQGDILHDVATLKYGRSCHIPSEEEFVELYDESSMIPDEFRGVVGFVVQGPNRKSIFIPAAGCRMGEILSQKENELWYWLSDLDSFFPDFASCFIPDNQYLNLTRSGSYRCVGCPIRAVQTKQEGGTRPKEETSAASISAKEQSSDDDLIYEKPEQLPSFAGGDAALAEFLRMHLKYPSSAQENNIQGSVIVLFVVEKDGTLSNIRIYQSVDSALDKEAYRVVKSMPKFIPGKNNGKIVRTAMYIPVTFRLQ